MLEKNIEDDLLLPIGFLLIDNQQCLLQMFPMGSHCLHNPS